MADELEEQLDEGKRLALALVDHVTGMGAEGVELPVVDRAVEYVVVVIPKARYDRRMYRKD